MFGIGPMELIVIAIFAIVFIGPQNLPHALGKFAKFFVKAKRYSSDIKVGFDDMVRKAENEMHLAEVEENLNDLKKVGAIDGQSLKPLSTQKLDDSATEHDHPGTAHHGGAPAEAAGSGDDSELFAGLPTHLDGKPVNPSFDDMDEPASTPKPAPADSSAEEQQELLARLAKEEKEHEEMIRNLQNKLSDPKAKS